MKILFTDVAGFYTEDTLYQANILAERLVNQGHEVTVISSCFAWKDGKICKVPRCDKVCPDDVRLIRLEYLNPASSFYIQKIRIVCGLGKVLKEINPDIIFCHNFQFLSINRIIKFIKKNPKKKLLVDTHVTATNSGKSFLSLRILHGVFYKSIAKRIVPIIDRFYYIGLDEKDFAIETYGIPEELMEYYPLGGTIFSDEEYKGRREKARKELGLSSDELLFVHSGKLDKLKKTGELLKAFSAVKNLNARLVIAGSIPNETEEEIETLMRGDERIEYIGWKNADELTDVLCACDLYCQPGSVSATMQNAICCNSAVLSYPHKTYEPLDFGQFIWTEDVQQMIVAFNIIAEGEINLDILKESAKKCATELLDYSKLAARIYE